MTRWAPISSAHILNGPFAIISLAKIADRAMLQCNGFMDTDISTPLTTFATDHPVEANGTEKEI